MGDIHYENEQRFFKEASKLMQIFDEYNLEAGDSSSEPHGLLTQFHGNPARQLETAKSKVIANLNNVMAMFPNFTYKVDKGLENPNVIHAIVKFREAGEIVLAGHGNMQTYAYFRQLNRSFSHLIRLAPTAIKKVNTLSETPNEMQD